MQSLLDFNLLCTHLQNRARVCMHTCARMCTCVLIHVWVGRARVRGGRRENGWRACMHTCARVCICVHVSAHTSVVVGWPASVSMHTRARLCTRVHACVFGRGEACVHTRVRVHACARGVCDGWLACKRVHTRARVCPYMSKRVVGRTSTRVHTRARVCMHACTVKGGVVVYMGGGGWVRVGVVGCERQASLKRMARAARVMTGPEDISPRRYVF